MQQDTFLKRQLSDDKTFRFELNVSAYPNPLENDQIIWGVKCGLFS